MNKRHEFKKIRLLQTIQHTSRYSNKEGCIKIYANNSLIHEETKLRIAYKLKKQGFYILSEVTFLNGKRADLIAISPEGEGTIIEVLNSESEARYEEKLNSYPMEWEMIKVEIKEFNINNFEL